MLLAITQHAVTLAAAAGASRRGARLDARVAQRRGGGRSISLLIGRVAAPGGSAGQDEWPAPAAPDALALDNHRIP